MTESRHNSAKQHTTTGFARRALLLLTFLVFSLGSAWGQTVTGKTITIYQKAGEETEVQANFYDDVVAAFSELGLRLTQENCFTRWDVVKDGEYITLGQYYIASGCIIEHNNNHLFSQFDSNSTLQFGYGTSLTDILNAKVNFTDDITQLGCKIECYVTNNGWKQNTDPTNGYIVKVELILNDDGLAPDNFNGTYSGPEPEPITIELPITKESEDITVTVPTGAKYARFVLVKDGEEQTISRTGISLEGGQSFEDRPKRGVYIYKEGGLGESINVTVSLDAGIFEDYQLVAYFSSDTPEFGNDGTTITKEPDNLSAKQIYSFTYPLVTVDKYIKWDTNTTTIDLGLLIGQDFPILTSSSTTGYIGWSVYDETNSRITIYGNSWSAGNWQLYYDVNGDGNQCSMGNTNGSATLFSISDNQLSTYWNQYTRPTLQAPSNFQNYPNHIVVAEVSDVSSEKIRVRYIFHFNNDGQPPYDFINETDIEADKNVLHLTDYEARDKELDLSKALVDDAQYVRIYVEKYGYANAESANLTVAYNGNPLIKCGNGANDPNEKYGWYYSGENIDPDLLKVTGLDANNMIKYNVVIVSSSEALSGEKEPAWEKKYIYSFQKDIKNRIMASDETSTTGLIDLRDNILSTLDASVTDFSKSLYAKWYVLSPEGVVQEVTGGNYSGDSPWHFDLCNSGLGLWTNDNNILRYFTDDDERTSSVIENPNDNGKQGWFGGSIAIANGIYVPNGIHTSDYIGYQIVFEFSDEYDTSTGKEPPYKLKYIYTIADPNAFIGELSEKGVVDGKTQTVGRSDASVTIDLQNGAFAHEKLQSPNELKYARFYVVDTKGNFVNSAGMLVVTYEGGSVTTCTESEHGYYIYQGPNTALDPSKISVQFKDPKKYILHKVVGVFSTEMTEVLPEDGNIPLMREPDWELQYIYSFVYSAPTTKTYEKTVEWRRNGIIPAASTTNPDKDWDTSWEELTLGHYVKWYVVDGNGNKQELVSGNSRQSGSDTWAIQVSGYTVDEDKDEAILTGQSVFTSTLWNTWGKPTIYAPAGVDFESVQNYKIICEIYTNSEGTNPPNARYEFSMYKSFLGELTVDDENHRGGTTIEMENSETQKDLDLGLAQTGYGKSANYVRVWLTTVGGTMVDPTSKLSKPSGMTLYGTIENTDKSFGYYLTNSEGFSLNDIVASLSLSAGLYDQYQVHVAFSKNELGTFEPDYDYVYTFSFKYGVKTKYKTLIYDESSNSCTPHLLGNWQELAVDCNEGRNGLEGKLYLRWYLTDLAGNVIDPATFKITPNETYTQVTEGYYRFKFDKSKFTDRGGEDVASKYLNSEYNPTITLPTNYTYDQVRVVCVATTKTENYSVNPSWEADPEEIQMKYVYILKKESELQAQPFVHYQGEAYRYMMELGDPVGATKYDYVKIDDSQVNDNKTWNSSANDYTADTRNLRQNVHTVDYYYYLNLSNEETASLVLPLQYYTTGGNDTEPRAYFRWYDYNTDMASDALEAVGSELNKEGIYVDENRGLFALPFSVHPQNSVVGVNFKAPANFENITREEDAILIACDISRYLDGMDESFTYLVHEPTLSIRYLFHIMPAKIIADNIAEKANANHDSKTGLAAVEDKIKTRQPYEPISILENEGRIVISTNNGTGKFSMRPQLTDLGHYYVYNSGKAVSATELQWYGYYNDGTNWWRTTVGSRNTSVHVEYTLRDINGGTWWQENGDEWQEKSEGKPTIGMGDRIQMIACVGDGSVEMPISWKELEFIDAEPLRLGDETEENMRSANYMKRVYKSASTLDFNDFSLLGLKTPENSFENYVKVPLEFPNAQYGYCYPQLYGLCATNKISTQWGVYGISPLHGDYTLLKSMNMSGISEDENRDNQSILCQWWDNNKLFDVTHERARGKDANDTNDYGGFLYVDAADEARTIATLEFVDTLCSDAKIYYTAYVASMTNGATKPMLRFRMTTFDEEQGKLVPVLTFVTGDISGEATGYTEGQWYQVYGYTTIPSEFAHLIDGTSRTYYVDIDNYCSDTNGADYCIDQISFYTSNAKLKVKQSIKNCEQTGISLNIYVSADDLKNRDEQTIYWRFYDEDGNAVTDPSLYNNDNKTYGQVQVTARPADESQIPTEYVFELDAESQSGYFKRATDGEIYFSLAKKDFALKEGRNYYISVYNLGQEFQENNNMAWGRLDDICSVYSPLFVPKAMYLSATDGDGNDQSKINISCGSTSATVKIDNITLNMPDDTQESGFKAYGGLHFDFFRGTIEEFNQYKIDGISLLEALFDFRRGNEGNDHKGNLGSYNPSDRLPNYGFEKEEYRTVIEKAMSEGLLYLLYSPQIEIDVPVGENSLSAIPVEEWVTATDNDGEPLLDSDGKEILLPICVPLEFTFNVISDAGGSSLTLGFEDVDYTNHGNIRVVRVGKEQLDNMQNTETGKGFLLHIPVNTYKTDPDATEKTGALEIVSSFLQLIKRGEGSNPTNDPMVSDQENVNVAIFEGDKVISKENNKMYISINFHDAKITNKPTFHEGFTYHMFFQVKKQGADDGACETPVEFLIKVVPEYVTWNDESTTEKSNVNANWNRDENWSRSKRTELYKGTTNTASKGHPDGYKDNGDLSITTTPAAFVPMKFTYVTMPSGNIAPNLLNLEIGSEGIYNNIGTGATDDIVYDLMVRYTETKCIDSKHSENGTGNIYDCEKFYGNWAKEIYFKPRAELVNQHYLTYEKVWVEKELTAGTWTLMSTPLQNTYAGDMYVPYNDDANKHGRQETEAFIPIKMTELQDNKLILLDKYSRTKYPIYQKSWGMNEGKVYTKGEDVRKSDYSALLQFPTNNVETTFAEWSHTFNDVWVDYSTWKGFAIRAHKSDYSEILTSEALIRLPKADDTYEYYDWKDNNEQQPTTDKTLDRSKYGKLFTDKDGAGEVTYGVVYGRQERTAKDDAEVTVPVGDVQEVDGYLLVGNPYLCSINMAQFLEGNKDILDKDKYWTYEGNTALSQLSDGQIQPLQSFFVKLKEGVTVDNTTNVKFTSAMMVGNNGAQKVMPKPMMTMTAANDRGKSTATVSVVDEARSVETLFDSNLNDVPMVYTVAEGQAVSINQLTELDKPIAFGVTCTASNEPVAVTFTDIEQLTSGDVFVVDAVTGEQTAVGEGSSVSVQPNDYGRYFLLSGTMGINDKTAVQKGIVVSIRDRGVTITSGEALTLVRATLLDGITAYQYTGGNTTVSFTLIPGVYIIHAENAAGEQQKAKVIVK